MHQGHSVTKLPTDLDSPIWRYVDLAKFLDLLSTSQLYFARADNLNDPFEGSWPLAGITRRKKHYTEDSEVTFQYAGREFIDGTYVNCWHLSPHESAAMWNLYAGASKGIAIRSTCRRLIEAFRTTDEAIHLSEIRYIDYRTQDFEDHLHSNFLTPFVYKRLSFEHERELRAIVCKAFQTDTPKYGIKTNVDLEILIDAVFISPDAEPWFKAILEDIVPRFGLKFPIHTSDLAIDPVY